MITDIAHYIEQRGQVPLRDLALHFKMDERVIESMLDRLVQKGRIRELPGGTACGGGCQQCAPEQIRIFAWTGNSSQ